MRKTLAPLAAPALLLSLALPGCDNGQPAAPPPVDPHAGHDHGPGEHHSGHGAHAGDDHGQAKGGHQHALPSLQIAGRTVSLTLPGDLAPGTTLEAEVTLTGDPVDTLRGWVGTASGEGSLKSKGHAHGATHHVRLEAPDPLPADAAVWIELEAGGERTAGSWPVSGHAH